MAANRPIQFSNRSYFVLKSLLKFWRINLNVFPSKKYLARTKSETHFNWIKWLLKTNAHLLYRTRTPKPVAVPKIKKLRKTSASKPFVLEHTAARGWTFSPILQYIKVRIPQYSLPKLPQLPSLPKLRLPSLPRVSAPSVTVPKIELPSVSLPTVELPKVQVPTPKVTVHAPIRLKARIAFLLIFLFGLSGGSYSVYVYAFKDLPSPYQLSDQKQIVTTRILDRNGEVLFRIYEDENRTLVKLNDIPEDFVNATIAIEDKNFYNHHGFSVKGIVRAAIANSKDQSISQGGSTITQQLVKNRLLSPEKTLQRKVRELILSIMTEFTYTKDQILEMYFNQVAYGGSTYGAEEAAQRYFGKSVTNLNLAESALLAGLPAAPSVYTPFGSSSESAKVRQHEVLQQMVKNGYINQEQADHAYQEELKFRSDVIDIKAPHFVMYVRQLLAEKYGEDVVNQGGLEVRTTLDLPLQESTQKIVTDEVNKLNRLRINNGAALVTNPKTGEVLSMVGSKDYFDFAHDGQVNVTLRPRQPGSSIKPLTYAVSLERGKTPSSIIDDSPITFHSVGSPPYSPQNYDGKFHGKVTIRESLGSSYNIPAVKTLAEVGLDAVIDKGQEMGIDTWGDRRRFGLSLTLGGGEVYMTDMAELYSTFANYGYTTDLNPILEIKNYKGEVLYRNTCVLDGTGCEQRRALNPMVAYQITDILKDNRARTPAFGANSVLTIPNQEVAVKTGTTNNLRDNWAIGYTTDRLVAVWVGNNDNTPMSYVASGVTGASPIWNYVMLTLLDKDNPHRFSTPEGFIKVKVCNTTGTLPCQGCPSVSEQLYRPGTEPTKQCSPSWFQKTSSSDKDNKNPNRDRILNGATTTR